MKVSNSSPKSSLPSSSQLLMVFLLLPLAGGLFCAPDPHHMQNIALGYMLYVALLTLCIMPMYVAFHLALNACEQFTLSSSAKFHGKVLLIVLSSVAYCGVTVFAHFALFGPSDTHGWDNLLKAMLYYLAVGSFPFWQNKMPLLQEATKFLTIPSAGPVAAFAGPLQDPNLLYVEADDRQVKIVYVDRVQHIKARFNDIIASAQLSGQQVHKSFWVACPAIVETRRNGRNLSLILKQGLEVPVGRKFEKQVLKAVRARESQNKTD